MDFSSWRNNGNKKEFIGNLADVLTFDVFDGIWNGTEFLHILPSAVIYRDFFDSALQLSIGVATSIGEAALYYRSFGIKGLGIPLATTLASGIVELKRYLSSRKS